MAPAKQLSPRFLDNTALKYKTYNSPTSTEPVYVAGSNVLTSAIGYAERRPGFGSTIEGTPTTFTGTIRRLFEWRRWSGQFFIMACEITSTTSKVYKFSVGVDASFSLIFTSLSTEPFDFVVSNNFLFFGNGLDMRKYDGTTVTKWGITAPASSSSGANSPGTTVDEGSSWTNVNNVKVDDLAYATATTTVAPTFPPLEDATSYIKATNFGFTIPTTATINGIFVECDAFLVAFGGGQLNLSTIKAGTIQNEIKTYPLFTTDQFYIPFGDGADLWGSTWTPGEINDSTFGVAVFAGASGHQNSGTYSIDHIRMTVFYTDPSTNQPSTSTSGTGITATAGWKYVYCYSNSTTGHISSPSGSSISTGAVANKTVNVAVVASTDTQVDKIRVFRTTDGGDGVFFELSNSPFANSTGTVSDTTADISLSSSTAPTSGFNDPPPASKGFVWWANRIWMIVDNKVWMTGWEEINNGVAEECVPSGAAGNFWAYNSEVEGISVAQDGVLPFTADSVNKIAGDSLDTFSRSTPAKLLGMRQRATIANLGKLTVWLDSSSSVWTTDGFQFDEIGQDIRPDIDGINHSQAQSCVYAQKTFRWLVFLDGGAGKLRIFDIDRGQWLIPWDVAATAVCSAETSEGTWDLLVAVGGIVLKLTPGTFTDNGTAYPASGTLKLVNMVPDDKPGTIATPHHLSLEHNAYAPSGVSCCVDDDPIMATMKDITASKIDPPNRTQGVNIQEHWYGVREPRGRRIGIKLDWPPDSNHFKLYSIDMESDVNP